MAFSKNLVTNAPIRATVLDTVTAEVELPLGTEYYAISQTAGAGAIQWSPVSAAAAEGAATAYDVSTSAPSGNIFANDRTIYIHAEGGDVDYLIFSVREGR